MDLFRRIRSLVEKETVEKAYTSKSRFRSGAGFSIRFTRLGFCAWKAILLAIVPFQLF